MSDPASWAILVAAIGAVLVNVIVALRTNQKLNLASDKADVAAEMADVAAEKADVAAEKLEEVHVATNSKLTQYEEQLEAANQRIGALEATIQEKDGKAGLS